jgi:uncharacterized coiled-coil protein SlyX
MSEMGERVANLEARLDAHGQDLVEIRQSVVRLDARVERLEDKMDRRFQSVDDAIRLLGTEMHIQFRWLIAGIAGASLTVILAMFAKELLAR